MSIRPLFYAGWSLLKIGKSRFIRGGYLHHRKAIDITLEGSDYNKALLIISEKHEEIKHKILIDLERGGTYLNGTGMYTGEQKQIIYTVVSRREVAILEEFISKIDPDAFITVMDAREILGEGFQSLKHKVEE
jgi:uncharacterized membrane-anchored protein YitT (DUF2179 family)